MTQADRELMLSLSRKLDRQHTQHAKISVQLKTLHSLLLRLVDGILKDES